MPEDWPLVPKFHLGTQVCAKLYFAIIGCGLRYKHYAKDKREIEFQEGVRSQVQLGNEPRTLRRCCEHVRAEILEARQCAGLQT